MPKPKLQTRAQIAKRLGIKLTRLSTTLSIIRFQPTERIIIDGNAVHHYDAKKVAEIEALFPTKEKKSDA